MYGIHRTLTTRKLGGLPTRTAQLAAIAGRAGIASDAKLDAHRLRLVRALPPLRGRSGIPPGRKVTSTVTECHIA
jgi:hypothetical protein